MRGGVDHSIKVVCLPCGGAFPLYRRGNMSISGREPRLFPHRHLLGIEGLTPEDILQLLDMAEEAVEVSRQVEKKRRLCAVAPRSISFSRPPPVRKRVSNLLESVWALM